MISVLGESAVLGWGQLGLMRIIFVMNNVLGTGSIARPVDKQSSALPLSHGCPPPPTQTQSIKFDNNF